MAEWFIALAWKASELLTWFRGFKSRSIRHHASKVLLATRWTVDPERLSSILAASTNATDREPAGTAADC